MKICIISPTAIPIRNDIAYGGIESVISLAAEELVRLGHTVYLLASADSKTSGILVPITKKATGLGVAIDKEQENNRIAFEKAVKLEPDIIWDHTLSLHAQEIIPSRKGYTYNPKILMNIKKHVDTKHIPVIHSLHGSIHDPFGSMVKGLKIPNHYFLSISKDQYNAFKKELKESLRGYVYNAIDTNFYVPIKKKKDYLVWVGRYTMEKGAHIAIEAAHKAGFKMRLLGKLQEAHEFKYFAKFVRPHLKQHDSIYSNIEVEEKRTLFQEAQITIMPALWSEPFGLVSVESMSCGTPVIASKKGALPEIIGDYGEIVDIDDLEVDFTSKKISKDHKILAKRFTEGIHNLKKKFPMELHKYAQENFSASIMAANYLKYFDEILEETRRNIASRREQLKIQQ